MTTGYKSNGVDLANIFSPKGTHTAAATGYKTAGTDLNQQLLALADGSAVANPTGYKVNGADLNTIFGVTTPGLGLPTSVTVGSGRAGGTVTLTYNSSGTWAFSTSGSSATYVPSGAATSGTWLTSGVASDYTISMVGTGFINGADPGGGTDSYSTTCATPQSLSSNQDCMVSAVAGGVGDNASNVGTWTVKLYKSGVLVGQQSFNVDVESAG